jgi:citrate lyase subunit beta/citryl-CoA lyase
VLVRVNAAGSEWHEDDLAALRALAPQGPAAVMLPKAESAATIAHAADITRAPVVPLIESADGLHAIGGIAAAPQVLRIAFGHLDFQADIGMQSGHDERELDGVRLALVLASRRAKLASPLDGVTAALQDEPLLRSDTERGRRFGFGGKMCIHPAQVAVVNEVLAPTSEQREWARRVVAASEVHGTGAFRLDGQMIDAPVMRRARSILEAP